MAATRSSAESHRCSAYDEDLRWRMVYQRHALKYTYQRIASNLNVDISTVWRTVQLFINTGNVSKKRYNKDNLPRKINESILFVILQVVLERPGIYLREIQSHVEYLTGTRVSTQNFMDSDSPSPFQGSYRVTSSLWTRLLGLFGALNQESLSASSGLALVPARYLHGSLLNPDQTTLSGKAKTRRKTRILLCQP